jgi:ATP-dependent DNA helicase UvrD/PcrA
MKFIADLHIHSRYSRATSKSLDPERLFFWARKKGIAVIGTGDFTHPAWISELREKLVEAEEGLFRLAPELEKGMEKEIPPGCPGPTRFVLTGEISCIYKKNGKTRKVHHLLLMPDMPAVERFRKRLDRIGNITSDGRPILGLDSHDLLEITLEVSDQAFFIPAHVWTPWFSLFGSKSGFDTIEECFGDLTPHIDCLETGLSSDPAMNRLVSDLDRYLLVSNSDAHSASKLGREANLFDTDLDYPHMVRAMKGEKGFSGTIEFYPEEGKYHLDGHRKCRVRCEPLETRERGGLCPVCGKPMTVGVLNRVHELADREKPILTREVHSLIPLTEILSELLDCGPATKRVVNHYEELLRNLGPELGILMEVPLDRIENSGGPLLAEAVRRMRQGMVIRDGGYDGEFGRIRLFSPAEKAALEGQLDLFRSPGDNAAPRPEPPPAVQKRTRIREDKVHAPNKPSPNADPILGPLNDAQRKAVLHEGGHLLVVAGPGTGKTMTLTHRMAHMIRSGQVRAEEILGLTFTRKAAGEMGERIISLLQGNTPSMPRIATFHGFCLEVLRAEGERIGFSRNFSVCGEMDREAILAKVLSETGGRKISTAAFLKDLPGLKRATLSHEEEGSPEPESFKAFCAYQKRLADLGMVDLDDLEVETLRLFERCPAVAGKYAEASPEIFVDEYQDTNRVQVNLLKALARTGGARLFAIGDPNQAIYGFRGAEVEHFFRFSHDFPGSREITLTRNYRSAETLLKGAEALLGKTVPLEPVSREKGTLSIASCRTEKEEAEMIVATIERLLGGTTHFSLDSGRVASHEDGISLGFGDIGILYRLNAQGDAIQEALSRGGIPQLRSGERPLIEIPLVKLVWRFLQTTRYPETPFYLNGYVRILDEMELDKPHTDETFDPRGDLHDLIEKVISIHDLKRDKGEEAEALGRLMERAERFEGNLSSFLDFLALERGIDHGFLMGDRVALMSLHAAKGLEWPVVFMTGCEDGLLPCTLFGDRDDAEERRLFYVGMTRARSTLILSHARRRSLNGRVLEMGPSPFLKTLPPDLCLPLERGKWKPKGRPHRQLKLF